MAPFSLISLTGPVCQWWFWILWVYEYAGVQPWWYPLEAFIWGTSPRLNLPANSLCHFQVFLCIEKSCIVTRKSVSESLSVCIVVELQSRFENQFWSLYFSSVFARALILKLWGFDKEMMLVFGFFPILHRQLISCISFYSWRHPCKVVQLWYFGLLQTICVLELLPPMHHLSFSFHTSWICDGCWCPWWFTQMVNSGWMRTCMVICTSKAFFWGT
jgi:hypothetical protein